MLGVMFFALLALVLASTIALMSFSPTALAKKRDQEGQCEELTTSALNQAFYKLKQEPGFRGTVRVGHDRAWAVVTFDPSVASSSAVPVSVNLFDATTPTKGSLGRLLPPNSVQLFARAKVGPTTLTVENVLHAPPFEYSIATSGALVASGPMLVAGVKELSGSSLPPESELEPGHVASNGSVSLAGPSTRITGDVKAVGTVSSSGAVVEGQIEEHHSEVALPSIPVTSYDPGTDPAIVRTLDPSYPGLTVDGLARRAGSLVLNVSGLQLQNGLLYVDGNLTVNGGVSGLGAIVCTGDVTVNGGGTLSTTNLAAIVAKGRVTLNGTSGSRGYFRGLVYSETGLEASYLTLVGAFVQRSVSGSGEIKLTGCDVVYDPAAVQIAWEIPGFGPGGGGFQGGARLADGLTASDFFDKTTGHFDSTRVDSERVPYSYLGASYSSLEEAVSSQDGASPPKLPDNSGGRYPSWEAFFQAGHDRYRAQLAYMDKLNQARSSPALFHGKFSLDLNQFLNSSDRMRVVFWRDL